MSIDGWIKSVDCIAPESILGWTISIKYTNTEQPINKMFKS